MRYLLILFLPPLAVALTCRRRQQVLTNILLTLCLWLPGVVHAWSVVTDDERTRHWNTVLLRGTRQRLVSVLSNYTQQLPR